MPRSERGSNMAAVPMASVQSRGTAVSFRFGEATSCHDLGSLEYAPQMSGSMGRKAFRAKTGASLGFVNSSQREPKYKALSRYIVEHNVVVAFTMVLTIYALLGDDFRLMFTNKSTDVVFNWLVALCLFVFTIECILSVLGKKDYLWGFFFWLDIISTASLVFDITIVADELFAQQSGDADSTSANDVRGGRAAKIGARAGRVVRVLRLVRILKLYKAYYEAKHMRKRKQEKNKRPGDEDDWTDEDLRENEELSTKNIADKESHVGRKLSEITTRRVICLILAMLLGLPTMQADFEDQIGFSANYGADDVFHNFKRLEDSEVTNSSFGEREEYETALLRYIYYHNWYSRKNQEEFCVFEHCANEFYAQLFWVGVRGQNEAAVEDRAVVARVGTDLGDWEATFRDTNGIYNYGTMPEQVHGLLQNDWSIKCDSNGWASRGISLISEEIPDVVDHTVRCPDELRSSESLYVAPWLVSTTQADSYHLAFYFDLRPYTRLEASMNTINTLTVLVLLIVASLVFSSDANRLIVHPVERMINRVEAIRVNPPIALRMADDEFKAEEIARARKARAKKEVLKHRLSQIASGQCCGASASEPLETVILEKTIIKLGSLLALGFGEAGANIIGHNMRGGDSAGVDAMIPGTRVDCIIGVVRIRDFSTATEVLQSKIMTFVNQIAEIVHGVANEFKGAPNRNSGETFLVIWRLSDLASAKDISKLSGMSVVACVKILAGLHKSALLATYRGHPGLQYRLGTNCRVNLSFGLHAGWAIEGAVGTEFKIEASYLSPNVSIATSVERATQKYGVSIIAARSVVERCPARVVSKCRLIDRVIITGSAEPMDIYCVDLDYRSVSIDNEPPLNVVWNTRNRFKVRQFLESEKAATERDDYDVAAVFDADHTIQDMRRRYTVEFFQLFNMGFQNYSEGEWKVARRMLSCTRAILGTEDGPSSALLRHMELTDFEAPKEWKGVRDLHTSSILGE